MKAKNKNLNLLAILRDMVNTAASACILSVFFMYLREVFSGSPAGSYLGVAFIFATFFIDYAARAFCSNLITYLVIHIAMIPAAFLLHLPLPDMVVVGAYLSLLFYLALRFWTSENTSKAMCSTAIPSEVLILIVPFYIHSYYFLSGSLSAFILWVSILYLGLYYISIFLNKILTYTLSIPSGSVLPLKKILTTNISILALVLLMAVILICITTAAAGRNSSLLLFIGYFFQKIGRAFFRCVSYFEGNPAETPVQEPTLPEQESYIDLTEDVTKDLHGNEIIMLISNILQTLFLIALVAFLLYLCYQFFKTYMHKGTRENDIIEKTPEKVTESRKKSTGKTFWFHIRNNNERARKLYRKKIQTYQGTAITIVPSDTPEQLSKKIRHKTSEDVSDLTELYEKARYGETPLSDKELARVKQLTKK